MELPEKARMASSSQGPDRRLQSHPSQQGHPSAFSAYPDEYGHRQPPPRGMGMMGAPLGPAMGLESKFMASAMRGMGGYPGMGRFPPYAHPPQRGPPHHQAYPRPSGPSERLPPPSQPMPPSGGQLPNPSRQYLGPPRPRKGTSQALIWNFMLPYSSEDGGRNVECCILVPATDGVGMRKCGATFKHTRGAAPDPDVPGKSLQNSCEIFTWGSDMTAPLEILRTRIPNSLLLPTDGYPTLAPVLVPCGRVPPQ